jgi:hypothetical protein
MPHFTKRLSQNANLLRQVEIPDAFLLGHKGAQRICWHASAPLRPRSLASALLTLSRYGRRFGMGFKLILFLVLSTGYFLSGHALASGGGDHGAANKKKPSGPVMPYSMTGVEQCVVPLGNSRATPDCGTEEYEKYASEIDAYNQCVEVYEVKSFLPLRPCHRAKPKKGPNVRKLLDPP